MFGGLGQARSKKYGRGSGTTKEPVRSQSARPERPLVRGARRNDSPIDPGSQNRQWLQGVVQRLVDRGCGKEELSYLLGFPIPVDLLPAKCSASLTSIDIGRKADELGFLPRGTVCELVNSGRLCTVAEDSPDGDPAVRIFLDGAPAEIKNQSVGRRELHIISLPAAAAFERRGYNVGNNEQNRFDTLLGQSARKFDRFDAELAEVTADCTDTVGDHFATMKFG